MKKESHLKLEIETMPAWPDLAKLVKKISIEDGVQSTRSHPEIMSPNIYKRRENEN